MTRKPRKHSKTGIFHVMPDGINRQDLHQERIKFPVPLILVPLILQNASAVMESATTSKSENVGTTPRRGTFPFSFT